MERTALRTELRFRRLLLAVISILVAGSVIVIWRDQQLRSERAALRRIEFMSIALELANQCNDINRECLKSGKDLWSWRLKLAAITLPIPAESHPDWTQPWDSQRNRQFERFGKGLYCREDHSTFALGIAGVETALDLEFCASAQFPEDLILVLEVADRKTHWMQHNEFLLEEIEAGIGRLPGSDAVDGFHVIFADGAVWLLRRDTPLPLLCRYLTIGRAKVNSRAELSAFAIWKR